MYNYNRIISNVSGIKCFESTCYYNQDNNVKVDDRVILKSVEGSSFWKFNSSYYYHNVEGERILLSGERKHIIKHPLFINTIFSKKAVCQARFRRENRKWNWNIGIYDLSLGELIEESIDIRNFTVVTLNNNLCIGHYESKGSLLALNIEKLDDIIWKTEFNNLLIKKVLGKQKNNIYLAFENKILEINLDTGEINRSWKDLPGFEAGSEYKNTIPEPKYFSLDENQKKLIGTFHTFYLEIDLESGKASYYDLKEELQSHYLSDFRPFSDHPFDENHLYLTAHTHLPSYPKIDLDSIVMLNRTTLKIDWMYTFTDSGIGTNTPKITNTHLYQIDTEKNLYVFERVYKEA